jgi:type I restriction enzyme R subunit
MWIRKDSENRTRRSFASVAEDVFNCLGPEAREILDDLLEKYASEGELQFTLPDVLKLPPISHHGNVNAIIGKFGGADQLRTAVNQLQSLLYAA